MTKTLVILQKISQDNKIKFDTLTSKVIKVLGNDELEKIVNSEINKDFNSSFYDVKTSSGKVLRIYFRVESTNGVFRRGYRRTRDWKVFYLNK